MEHVAHGKVGLAVRLQLPVLTEEVSVAADNLLGLRVPYDKLFATMGHRIKLVDIHTLSRTASCCSEGDLSQSANLLHDMRSFSGTNDVNLIVALVGGAQTTVGCQLTLQQILTDGLDNLFFHSC